MLMFSDIEKYTRYGYKERCPDLKKFYSRDNSEGKYTLEMLKCYSLWKQMKLPFGVDGRAIKDGKVVCYFICIDFDSHHGEDNTDKINTFKRLFSKYRYSIENSVGGQKIWVVFSTPIEYTLLVPLLKFLQSTFPKTEIWPLKSAYPIRFPGLYKDYERFSKIYESEDLLDTFEKVEEFMLKAENPSEEIITLSSTFAIENEIENKNILKIKNHTPYRIITGYDAYFQTIFQFVLGKNIELKETNSMECPFHKDEHPSSALKYDEKEQRWLFTCFSNNCPLHNANENIARDAFDLVYFHRYKDLGKTTETIEKTKIFIEEVILPRMFGKDTTSVGKKVRPNTRMIVDRIFEYITQEDTPEICFNEHNILFEYNPNTHLWESKDDPRLESSIIYNFCLNILQQVYTPEIKYYLSQKQVLEIAKELQFLLTASPRKMDDIKKYTIPFKNGILDAKTKLFSPITKKDYVTLTLNCNYNPTAKNEAFYKMLCTYLPEENYRNLLLEYVGTCLVRNLHIQKLLFCVGSGGNGKGTVFNILLELFGSLAKSASIHSLSTEPTTAYDLVKTNMIVDLDSVIKMLDEKTVSIIKTITGDGQITVRRLYAQSYQVFPDTQFICCTNAIPALGHTVNIAIKRRLMIIPFNVSVPKNNTTEYWREVCEEEDGLDGIVNYILEKLYAFLANNSQFSMETDAEIKDYINDNDTVIQYITSLFLGDFNDAQKFPCPIDRKRLSNDELFKGVSIPQLFKDFCNFCEQTNNSYQYININIFRKSFLQKMKDPGLIDPDLLKYIYQDKQRTSAGYPWIINVCKYLQDKK